LGSDKAELLLRGERLADCTARVLVEVCEPALEVGPGRSPLPAVSEPSPGEGPLAALVAGASALRLAGAGGPIVLLAVDLPFVRTPLLEWLVERPGDGTIVPTDAAGEPQPCCARYGVNALVVAAGLVEDGKRSMHALLDATEVELVEPREWGRVAPPNALDDVDTPEDAQRLGLEVPA